MFWKTRHALQCTLGLISFLGFAQSSSDLPAQEPKAATKAQPATPEKLPQEKIDAKNALETLAAAHRIAEFGRQTKAPELLLSAARVLATVPVQPLKLDTKEPAKADATNIEESLRKDVEKLINEARELAKELPPQHKEAIESLVKLSAAGLSERQRMVVGGPRMSTQFLNVGQSLSGTFDLYGATTFMQVFTPVGSPPTNYNLRVVGALTGLEYANPTGFGGAVANFQHLPIAKVHVILTNLGPNNAASTFITN